MGIDAAWGRQNNVVMRAGNREMEQDAAVAIFDISVGGKKEQDKVRNITASQKNNSIDYLMRNLQWIHTGICD